MSSKYHLEIVTPDKNFYTGEVKMAVIETTEGQIGILKDHEPIVTPVAIGEIWIDDGESERLAACSSGFLTVDEEKTVVVVDSAEWEDDIDVDRAKQAKQRAKERLEKKKQDEIDEARAKAALDRAINRIRITE
jgi:F-type H+-transporting ATPase subunit epsilon